MEKTREQSGEEDPTYSDSYLLSKILEFHKPTYREPVFDSLLTIVKAINERATGTIGEHSKDALLEGGKGTYALQDLGVDTKVQDIIRDLSYQVTSEILNGKDAHYITMKLLNLLPNFYFINKMILILTALALTFGDFCLLIRIYADNAINGQELTCEEKNTYRNIQFKANEFIKYVDNLNKYRQYDGTAVLVYWVVRCAIVATTQLVMLSSRGLDQYLVGIRGFPTLKEFDKLESLNVDIMLKISESEMLEKGQKPIKSRLVDKNDIIKSIITPEIDVSPLYHGVTKSKDELDALNGKRVLLLISGLDIAPEDIKNLKHITINPNSDEIVWIPIVNPNPSIEIITQLETLQNSMPWYSVHQPSKTITEDAINYFTKQWNFISTPILILLSPFGEVLNKTAIHMVRIWQNLSFDKLTSYKSELQRWRRETWNLKLLLNHIDPLIQKWIQDEKYIFLYGGNDIEWIRAFIRQAGSLASVLHIHIEMVYVGISHNKDQVCRLQEIITMEKLSYCLPESSGAYFRSRLDSMIYSIIEFKLSMGVNFPRGTEVLLEEIRRFQRHEEWALLAKGSTILVNGSGSIALNALEQIEKWKTH
ncbi:protein SIEVE ELEMENT OCCLUSION B-like [Silene latifolia]|uniref:protein SIEVE ELEMENT OCCLUSION B-like n=1 Tax=Silene latifolia TaxID=37657 RepID=UPI003D7874C8